MNNEVNLEHTPETPMEVLYQQTVDDLRKDRTELLEALKEYHGDDARKWSDNAKFCKCGVILGRCPKAELIRKLVAE